MAKRNQEYGNDSISSLKGADRVRKRPAVIFGSDGLEGCEHSFFEILSNSIDEAREGFGKKIFVTRWEDNTLEVQDFGRGIPVDWNSKEGRYNWELVFCELYAGGKYKEQGDNYEFSLGLNGLGSCATQYASEFFDVTVVRDGFQYDLHFEKGEIVGEMKKTSTTQKKTGSRQRWRPDLDVFTDISIPTEFFLDTLKKQAVVNPGLTFEFTDHTPEGAKKYEFCYENGLTDYLKELLGEEEALTDIQYWEAERVGRDREDKPDYKVKLSVAVAFSNRVQITEYYHNSSFLEHGGSPERAVRQAFTSQIDTHLKQNGKYQKNESKITFKDVEDCLALISSSFSTQTSYENQTKKAITNKFIYDAMTDFLKHQLEIWFLENPMEANKIADQVLVNKRSREKAEKDRQDYKKKIQGNIDMSNRVQKFVDCRTKDVSKRELFIVEGDSALGSCKMSRDAEFQAIIPVRGKILNCLKADYDKIFKNDIITDLLKVLGCGVEVRSKANKELSSFDLSSLRWNKVVICTDADVDGFQIRTLILTMLYRLTPTLIEKGYVYIAQSPLYEITTKKRTYFAYNEVERTQIMEMIGDDAFTIQRSKGLGENDPDMMWLTTMNPETRRAIKITPEDAQKTAQLFDLLLGDDLQGRKDMIAEHGHEYLDMLDIS